jgi:hypothetical protein
MENERLQLNLKRKKTQHELALVTQAYKKQRRRQLYLATRSQPVNATRVTRQMCMQLLVINNFEIAVPRIWLKRRYGDAELKCSYTDEDWNALIEKWFMEAPLEDINKLPDYISPSGLAQYTRAAQFTAEYRTESYVFACNQNKGVAPTSDNVVSRYELERRKLLLSMMNGLDGPPTAPIPIGRRRNWAHWFRIRWGAKYGSMGVREEYTIEQLRAKAWAPTLVAF